MSLSYKFSNLCGTVYKGGRLVFTPDGNRLLSPVGSRLTLFDLVANTALTLPCQTRSDIVCTAVSPDGSLLLAVDAAGHALLVNLSRQLLLQTFNFKAYPRDLKFSPDGRFFAITIGKRVQIWRVPGRERKFMALSLYMTLGGCHDDVTTLDWSHDSRYLLAGSRDATTRVFPIQRVRGLHTFVLGGHKDKVVHACFDKDSLDAYTISRDGTLLHWVCTETPVQLPADDVREAKRRQGHVGRQGLRAVRLAATDENEEREVSDEEQDEEEEQTTADGPADDDAGDSDADDSQRQRQRGRQQKGRGVTQAGTQQQREDSDDEDDDEVDDSLLVNTVSDEGPDEADALTDRGDGLHIPNPLRRQRKSADGADDDSSADEDDDSMDGSGALKTVMVPHWKLAADGRKYFMQGGARVSCVCFHAGTKTLTVGFTNGVFSLYELPGFHLVHSLSISQKRLSSVAVNGSGEWLAFGSAAFGQLLVWEWQSESYILKQQGHFYDTAVVAYSPDGHVLATGGDDGKVKLWSSTSSFCYVTFKDHTGPITGVAFAQNGLAVVSASLDGTVRAFDTVRYRNFRTFTAPHPTQFSCLALDPSGEIVCAGCQDTFEIYVWSMQTGKLLDVLAGHKGPVSALAFHPSEPVLLSGSWDKTVKIWAVFEGKGFRESIDLEGDVVAVAFRPDGQQFVTSSLKGMLEVWAYKDQEHVATIDCRRDLLGGRRATDKVTAKQLAGGRCYTSLCFSADGSCLLAGGQSRYVNIYEISQQVLLKRFSLTSNQSLDALTDKPNSRNNTAAGPMALIDDDGDDSDDDGLQRRSLPGVAKGDFSSRRAVPEIRTRCVQFSPTGRAWAAATTEGLVIFSLDDNYIFDPLDLEMDITPDNLRAIIKEGAYLKAVVMSFRLGEKDLIREAIEAVPARDVQLVAQNLPTVYLGPLLKFLAVAIDSSRHIGFYMTWCQHLLNAHGRYVKDLAGSLLTPLRALQKSIILQREALGRVCEQTKYSISYLVHLLQHPQLTQDDVQKAQDLGQIAATAVASS